jgi:phosphomannomutase
MHGVSHPWVVAAFEHAGLPKFTAVREQQQPDPEFPTVKFPNPEEKGALVCPYDIRFLI